MTRMQSKCEICYCNVALERESGSYCATEEGEGSFSYVEGPRNPSKPSKNVDKQIPEMKSSPAPGWMCP